MGIEQYVDVYYLSKDKVKVGGFYAERIGKVIRVNGLNIVFNSHKEAKTVFDTIKNTIKNLSLDSPVILFQNKYVLITLALSAIWEYNWVYSTDSALVFPSESEAGKFFEQLKKKLLSLKVRDVIGVIGGKATSQSSVEVKKTLIKKVKFNILEDNAIKYIPFYNPSQIQVFKVIQGGEELAKYTIDELNPLLSKYAVILADGSVSERSTDILETSQVEGKPNLYEATLNLENYEDITQIYALL